MREKILSYLGSGLEPGQVASAVGCTPGYISQLLSEPEFAAEVVALRAGEIEKYKGIDNLYDKYELMLLEKFEELIPFIQKPKDVLAAIQQLNQAKRRSSITNAGIGNLQAGTVVNINLPAVIVQNYKINMAGGMVEVAGRTLKPMGSKDLLKSLEDRRSENAAKGPLLTNSAKGAREAIVIDENSV